MEIDFGQQEIRLLCCRFRLCFSKWEMHSVISRTVVAEAFHITSSLCWIMLILFQRALPPWTWLYLYLTYDRHYCRGTCQFSCSWNWDGPPLQLWQPDRYVKSWLMKHCSASDTRTHLTAPTCADAFKNLDPCEQFCSLQTLTYKYLRYLKLCASLLVVLKYWESIQQNLKFYSIILKMC